MQFIDIHASNHRDFEDEDLHHSAHADLERIGSKPASVQISVNTADGKQLYLAAGAENVVQLAKIPSQFKIYNVKPL